MPPIHILDQPKPSFDDYPDWFSWVEALSHWSTNTKLSAAAQRKEKIKLFELLTIAMMIIQGLIALASLSWPYQMVIDYILDIIYPLLVRIGGSLSQTQVRHIAKLLSIPRERVLNREVRFKQSHPECQGPLRPYRNKQLSQCRPVLVGACAEYLPNFGQAAQRVIRRDAFYFVENLDERMNLPVAVVHVTHGDAVKILGSLSLMNAHQDWFELLEFNEAGVTSVQGNL